VLTRPQGRRAIILTSPIRPTSDGNVHAGWFWAPVRQADETGDKASGPRFVSCDADAHARVRPETTGKFEVCSSRDPRRTVLS